MHALRRPMRRRVGQEEARRRECPPASGTSNRSFYLLAADRDLRRQRDSPNRCLRSVKYSRGFAATCGISRFATADGCSEGCTLRQAQGDGDRVGIAQKPHEEKHLILSPSKDAKVVMQRYR